MSAVSAASNYGHNIDDCMPNSSSNHEAKSTTISSWRSITTRLLDHGGSSGWNVIDQFMESATENPNFCDQLYGELRQAKLWNKLKPARTKGDAQAQNVLELLQGNNFIQFQEQPTEAANEQSPWFVRGDKSLFLSREYRQQDCFPQHHPCLHQLITTISNEVFSNLSNCIEFDASMTSVQLAVYPGDGKSGYIRHCDRGQESCKQEHTPLRQEMSQRVITVVYYLTHGDWDASLDGGCLRLFCNPQSDQYWADIVPYRDRMIIFRSDGVEHQVLPSHRRERAAITVWFYGRMKSAVQHETSQSAGNHIAPVVDTLRTQSEAKSSNQSSSPQKPEFTISGNEGPPPLPRPPPNADEKDLPSIFVSIASYRDSETAPTLESLFGRASHPDRVFVGLVLQNDERRDAAIWDAIKRLSCYSTTNIRCIRMNACDAVGPCYARALCQSLHRGEEYILQTDSHMRYRQNWDEYLIHQLTDIQKTNNNPKVVLTAYPIGYHLPNRIPNETRGTLLVPWKFDSDGWLRQRGRLLRNVKPKEVVPCLLYAAGFNFAPSSVMYDVPYNQSLHHLFFGEELDMAVRLYTHGYDLYAPSESVCYHLWSRSHRPVQHQQRHPSRSESEKVEKRKKQSMGFVQNLLAGHESVVGSHYGLGTHRTASAFAKALRVNFGSKSLLDGCENGCLSPDRFNDAELSTLFDPGSNEGKIASLDSSAKALITDFLSGVDKRNFLL